MHLEPPILRAVGGELHVRKERILFVEHAVSGEVQHPLGGTEAAKGRFRRGVTGQNLCI